MVPGDTTVDTGGSRPRQKGRVFAVDTYISLGQPSPCVRNAGDLRIAVVSEVRFLREGVAAILESDPRVSVAWVCADLDEVMVFSPTLQPDIVLLDAAFRDGPAAAARLRYVAPEVRTVVFA